MTTSSVPNSPPSKRPRYAPPDPTLPSPWRALIDGSTDYLYYWNPETKVTQYERPVSEDPPPTLVASQLRPGVSSSMQQPKQQSPLAVPEENANQNPCQTVKRLLLLGSRSIGNPSIIDSTEFVQEPSIVKHHKQSSAKSGPASSTAEAYRRQHEITVTGDVAPDPYMTFQSTGFPPDILKEVHHAGFSAPTPIQAQSWPIVLRGRDIVAIAKTGSGKTLGFLMPGFVVLKRNHNNSKMGPTVLILSPTRELATQIQDEAVKFGKSSRISCVCLYGGAQKGPQLRELDRGADIIVATPGRLNDILNMKRLNLHQVSYLVLDEADRMLDMGFEPQLRKIVDQIPSKRQTLMFTATWPKEVRRIAADFLTNPVQVNIGNTDTLVANKAITQYVEVITPMEKHRRLERILCEQEPGSRIIIFCSTKRMCDQLARNLSRRFEAAVIHGDKSQSERDCVLSQFRSGKSPILVATDVAARGLDVKDIRVVINYDFPTGVEDYVHRIGRTGRAGAKGVAYTFFCDQDSKFAAELVKVLKGADQHVPSELLDMTSRGGYGGRSRRWGSGSDAYDNNAYSGGGWHDSHGQSNNRFQNMGQSSSKCGSVSVENAQQDCSSNPCHDDWRGVENVHQDYDSNPSQDGRQDNSSRDGTDDGQGYSFHALFYPRSQGNSEDGHKDNPAISCNPGIPNQSSGHNAESSSRKRSISPKHRGWADSHGQSNNRYQSQEHSSKCDDVNMENVQFDCDSKPCHGGQDDITSCGENGAGLGYSFHELFYPRSKGNSEGCHNDKHSQSEFKT
ncbi:hypothetical protein ZIOFF_061233 [Zingiber officinale]|uniref:RNA helicase n=1 Tax=Zingiber officinale TaxID=94328 RepID=A0A8J5EZB2_ZINOF|nr:hypothetical protein ZIOFF_061233 [Zingiber officinale]